MRKEGARRDGLQQRTRQDRRDPIVIPWCGRTLRIRHDDPRLKPYSPQASRLRSAVELASDVEGLRLVLESALGDRYRVQVSEDRSVVGMWRRT